MITQRVVLILGAGASNPYGFPLGRELVEDTLAVAGDTELQLALGRRGVTPDRLTTFCNELRASLALSVDAFLETRREFEQVGKLVLAYLLIRCEHPDYLFNAEHDPDNEETWYQYLFELMRTDELADFGRNNLGIISYNYDRSLEYCFFRALQASYGRAPPDCRVVLSQIPIIHLHGTLGSLDGPSNKVRPYNSDLSEQALAIATQGIRIVHEVGDNEPQFQTAHQLIAAAQHVVFLGFAYYRKNVERLRLGELTAKGQQFWGTAHGFTQSEAAADIQSRIPQLTGGNLTYVTVIEFLRNHRHILA